MAVDPSIGLQSKVPNMAETLGSYVSLGQRALDLQKSRETFASDVQRAKAESDIQQTAAQNARMSQQRDSIDYINRNVSQLITDKDLNQTKVLKQINSLHDSGALPEASYKQLINKFSGPEMQDPGSLRASLARGLQSTMDASAQLASMRPEFATVDTGAEIQRSNISPSMAALSGANPLAPKSPEKFQKKVAPGIVTVKDPNTGQDINIPADTYMDYLHKTGAAATGFSAATSAKAKIMQDDQQATKASADAAQQSLPDLDNFTKAVKGGAIVGPAQDLKQKYGIFAALLGDKSNEADLTATQEASKYAAQLAQSAGDTNLAKQLGEMGNPNVHMTKDAIIDMVDRLRGIQKMNIAKAKYMQQYGDPTSYTDKGLKEWRDIGDYRAFQLEGKTKDERKKMLSGEPNAEKILRKAHELQKAGLIEAPQ